MKIQDSLKESIEINNPQVGKKNFFKSDVRHDGAENALAFSFKQLLGGIAKNSFSLSSGVLTNLPMASNKLSEIKDAEDVGSHIVEDAKNYAGEASTKEVWEDEVEKLRNYLQKLEKTIQASFSQQDDSYVKDIFTKIKKLVEPPLHKNVLFAGHAEQNNFKTEINSLLEALKSAITSKFGGRQENLGGKILSNFQENTSFFQQNQNIKNPASKVFLPGVTSKTEVNLSVNEKNSLQNNDAFTSATSKNSFSQEGNVTPLREARQSANNHGGNFKNIQNMQQQVPSENASAVPTDVRWQLKAARHQVRLTGNFTGNNHLKLESSGGNPFMSGAKETFATSEKSNSTIAFPTLKSKLQSAVVVGTQKTPKPFFGKLTNANQAGVMNAQQLNIFSVESMTSGKVEEGGASPKHARASEIIEKIVGQIKLAYSGGREFISIKLQPAQLGSVDVWMKKQNGKLSLKLKVENEEVRGGVLVQMESLKASMKQAGIDIDEIQIVLQPAELPFASDALATTEEKGVHSIEESGSAQSTAKVATEADGKAVNYYKNSLTQVSSIPNFDTVFVPHAEHVNSTQEKGKLIFV